MKVLFYDYIKMMIDSYDQLSTNPVIKDMVKIVLERLAAVNSN